MTAAPAAETVFDALLASLQAAAAFNANDTVAPAAVLWPDERRDWERLVPRLRAALPQFLVLGPYDAASRTGPAIWLRCVLAGKVPAVTWEAGAVPILYLPGVSRSTLRATEECPDELKPIAELQYRGVFWSQQNTKDWTLTAFLQTNHGGLQLRIARDQATTASIRRAIERLVDVPIAELRARSASSDLNSTYFDSLISDDPVDDLLTWLAAPEATRASWDEDRWDAMCGVCRKNYDFDPATDDPRDAAEKLGLHAQAAWKTAWKRFTASPTRYTGLADQLRRAKPKKRGKSLFEQPSEAWPQDNEAAEAELRKALLDLASAPAEKAREALLELEQTHGPRREWVWARLRFAPLAEALRHLSLLAEATKNPLLGGSPAELAGKYAESGWKADAAALDALAAVSLPHDCEAVASAVSAVYGPWLRDTAELFQLRVKAEPLPGRGVPRLGEVPIGTCVLFADGLRFDISQKLKAVLDRHFEPVQLSHHFVALPSVTPTAKPAVSPAVERITGTKAGEEFRPCLATEGKDLTPDRFRTLLDDLDYQVLGPDAVGNPAGRAWTEFGNLDRVGHDEGVGLARRVPELVAQLTYRVESLVAAGWKEVRIVTDHGWLLLPKGLPKTDLPKYLAETRWGRCAVVKPKATVDLPSFPWFWEEDVRIACPPGIGSFIAGKEYGHGGLSLQECVVPQLVVRASAQPTVSARIESHKWVGLRCRVKIDGQCAGCAIDLRDKPADPTTSLAQSKEAKSVGADGTAALVVEDDTREGTATTLLLLDPAGDVIDRLPVTVGG